MTSMDQENRSVYPQQKSKARRLSARKLFKAGERGQAFVILALTFLALLAFVGLAIDVGQLYVTYTHLKRAVDAAAVAAANNIKSASASPEERKTRITEAARDMLTLNRITDVSTLEVYVCTDTDKPQAFADLCPDVAHGEAPRKLAWVQAVETSPVYFLSLFGIQAIPFQTDAVGEAATVDLVLVFDTSESMASDTDCSDDGVCTPGYNPNDFNPATCNAGDNCYPMRQAKDAARGLIANFFDGYDQIAIVHYDYKAEVIQPLTSTLTEVGNKINQVHVHDDPPSAKLIWYKDVDQNPNIDVPDKWNSVTDPINPIFPDDRDGDGQDADPGAECVDEIDYRTGAPGKDMWDDNTGLPCDDDDTLDAFDWNNNGDYTDDNVDNIPGSFEDTSLLSTCIGCGMRVATNVLKAGGRPQSIWVIVFLTDGYANLSDRYDPTDDNGIPDTVVYGFCSRDSTDGSNWTSYCIDKHLPESDPISDRYCIDEEADQCPDVSTHTEVADHHYSVEDYARDMTDSAALLYSTNPDEPSGEDIIIYAIGLGSVVTYENRGWPLLRYMGNIGDDGSRANDQCLTNPTQPFDPATNPYKNPTDNCGNYYFSPSGGYLDRVFESIAGRIFTKISR
jgi:Flp pilus assembly protein TadG